MANEANPAGSPATLGRAPADAVPRPPWPTWRKVLAYLVLGGVAVASVCLIDAKVHRHEALPVPRP